MRTPILLVALALSFPACAEEPPPLTEPANGTRAGLTWEEPVRVASGEAYAGVWRMNDSDWRYVDDATVALDPDGDAGVAWVDQARQNVFFQRFDAEGRPQLDEPVDVSKSPDIFSWLPRLVMAGDDVYVLWQEIVFSGGTHGGEAFFARSTNGGRSFEAPVNLSNTPNGAGKGRLTERAWHNGSLDLAPGADGRLYAAWTEYEGPLRVRVSPDAGKSWSDAVLVAGDEDAPPARGPSLALGPDGRLHLAWTMGEDPRADIRYATSNDGGQSFGEPRRIDESFAHADAPKVAVHEDGTVHLAWMDSPEGPFRAYRVRYVRKEPGAEAFTDPKTLSDPLPRGFTSAGFPYLELDARGKVYVLFELFDENSRQGTGLALVHSGDGGETFTAPGTVPRGGEQAAGTNGSRQGLLMDKLAVTPEGGLAVVNSTFEAGEASHVWLIRTAELFPGSGEQY